MGIHTLLKKIRACEQCTEHLALGPNPVLAAHAQSRIIIIGQAPGIAVHGSGIPWNDKSGENLRHWLDVDSESFYDPQLFGIIPMGFCYPGKGKSGDLPPRPECAPLWHEQLFDHMKEIDLILLIGQYAQRHYLGNRKRKTLTETVQNYRDYLPEYFVLPHPSPRNNIWQAKNAWFKKEVVPELRNRVQESLSR